MIYEKIFLQRVYYQKQNFSRTEYYFSTLQLFRSVELYFYNDEILVKDFGNSFQKS